MSTAHDWGALGKPAIRFHGQPDDESKPAMLWDGEWEITYVTFRDMGAAFMVAIVGIYILVVAQFGSFKLPLVVLTPIPLTLIGIVIGHWLFGAPFTATSMIGFIALAGIIVRNSILLVDFIRHGAGQGKTLREVLLEAGAVRFKPILLTALAAMIGAATILLDPIFQGLAISLLFGLASSTLAHRAGDPGDLRRAARRRSGAGISKSSRRRLRDGILETPCNSAMTSPQAGRLLSCARSRFHSGRAE